MNTLIALLQVLLGIICLMLIGIILLQRSKGQGTGLSFGGGAAEAIFGSQMGNVLTRTTVVLGFLFLAIVVSLIVIKPTGRKALSMADRLEQEAARTAPSAIPSGMPMEMPDYSGTFQQDAESGNFAVGEQTSSEIPEGISEEVSETEAD